MLRHARRGPHVPPRPFPLPQPPHVHHRRTCWPSRQRRGGSSSGWRPRPHSGTYLTSRWWSSMHGGRRRRASGRCGAQHGSGRAAGPACMRAGTARLGALATRAPRCACHPGAQEMGIYMDNLIAENKRQDAREKREKEEKQAATAAMFTEQVRTRSLGVVCDGARARACAEGCVPAANAACWWLRGYWGAGAGMLAQCTHNATSVCAPPAAE